RVVRRRPLHAAPVDGGPDVHAVGPSRHPPPHQAVPAAPRRTGIGPRRRIHVAPLVDRGSVTRARLVEERGPAVTAAPTRGGVVLAPLGAGVGRPPPPA